MPANTPGYSFPYPLPTEPVAEGAQAIRNLAEAIEARLVPGTADRHVPVWDNTAKKWVPANSLLPGPGQASRRVAFGQLTLTFSANPISNAVTVAHGLGVAPSFAFLTAVLGAAYCLAQVASADATNLVVQGRDTSDANRTGTNTVYWLAVA